MCKSFIITLLVFSALFCNAQTNVTADDYQTSSPGFDMRFFTNNNTFQSIITTTGKFGFGLTTPQNKLHIHSSEIIQNSGGSLSSNLKLLPTSYNQSALQITNDKTGATSTDGLFLGLKDNVAYLQNYENDLLSLITGSSSILLHPTGEVSIGGSSTNARLTINAINKNGLQLLSVGPQTQFGFKTIVSTENISALAVEKANKYTFEVKGNGTTTMGGTGINQLTVGSASGASLFYGNAYLGFNARRNAQVWNINSDGANNGGSIIWGNVAGDLYFAGVPSNNGSSPQDVTDNNLTQNNLHMVIRGNGQVGIGTLSTMGNYKLTVCGDGIWTTRVSVRPLSWCDYVFEPDYKPMPLTELENYINENKHLPDIPSEKEVLENGIEVTDVVAKLLKKVEELTLYTIAQEKRILELETQLAK